MLVPWGLVDRKRHHLTTLRAIGRRMLVGSALVRLWAVLVVAALLAVAANPVWIRFEWLALFMAIVFWGIDAHLARQRILFERTRERVRQMADADIEYTLDTSAVDGEAAAWSSMFLSPNLAAFYGTIIGLIALFHWVAG